MASDGDLLLRTVLENPDDAAPRLVLADWCDENGQPERATMFRGVAKRFPVDFNSPGGALTLNSGEICDTGAEGGHHSRTHPDGWTISGQIHEDYYVWVNDFEASHPTFGRIEGNFENMVFACSEEAFQDFYAKHKPEAWDYMDI